MSERHIDDHDFKEITRKLLQGREEEAARESGLDVDAALKRRRERQRTIDNTIRRSLDAISGGDWFGYQFLPLSATRPAIIFQIVAEGVAGVSEQGQIEIGSKFLFLVAPPARGEVEGTAVTCLMRLTPLWHPQVGEEGEVFLAPWLPATWKDLVETLHAIVRYRNYDLEGFVLNEEAAIWAKENKAQLPLKD